MAPSGEFVLLMHDEVDAVLGFCLPVDRDAGKRALENHRTDRNGTRSIDLPCRVAAGLAIDHMHREAKLRLWEGEAFTSVPTYVLWRVGDEGTRYESLSPDGLGIAGPAE